MTLMEEICANLCPEDIVDEMTVAANNLPLPAVVPPAPCATDGPEKPVGSGYGCPAMSKSAAPRAVDQPEAQEVWPMTLSEAMRIALDNSEIVRVISFGAAGLPIGGFEPTPMNNGAAAGVISSLGSGILQSVYDPAILETQIATALLKFDTAFTTSILWGDSTQPFNDGVQGGSLSLTGIRFPIVSLDDSATWQAGLSKRTATGALLGIVHNLNWSYQRISFLVWPSSCTTNRQLTLTQPLLGSAPRPGQADSPPVGLEASRAPIVIARLNADASIWRFKAEVMAELRSVEQLYWNLAQAHVQLWAADRAVSLTEEILRREQAELLDGRGTVADVAETQQRLEQFRLDLVTRTSDVITTERQLRSLLGLPRADNRLIIPVTPPTDARLEPDWDSSLAQMLGFQPDIVQQRTLVRAAELCLLMSRNQLLPLLGPDTLHEFQGLGNRFDCVEATVVGAMFKALSPLIAASNRGNGPDPGPDSYKEFTTRQVGLMYPMPMSTTRYPLANTRQAQYALLRSRARYEQIVHQTTHSLARFFLEIDANYKQFQTATRMRKAAAQRLDAQRAHYEQGRITRDRFLDAVGQYATAVATEAQYQAAYNASIVALEEAKGTLLASDGIVVAEGPRPRKTPVAVAP